jgi:hypothetical protein
VCNTFRKYNNQQTTIMKNNIKNLTAILGIAAAGAFNAQATISDYYGLGSAWSGTPTFETVAAPTFAAAEGNFGGGTANGLGQTFSLTTAGILTQIQIGMAGTGSYGMALYDLGVGPQTPSGGSSFTLGTDLLSSGSAVTSFTTTLFTGSQVANFVFSGADAVSLSANEYYMFVLTTATANTSASAVQWTRGGSAGATFTGGQFFRASSGTTVLGAINGGIRQGDFALTVTPAPEPTTLALAGLGGLASLVALRRKK